MYQWLRAKPGLVLGAGLAMGLLVGVGMLLGALAAASYWIPSRSLSPLPETLLHASTSQAGDSFSIATGQIDENVEGVFTLDFITGDLMCFVISVKTGEFNGMFRYNVANDLQVERTKRPKYLLATGQAIFVTGGGLRTLGNCVVYVADANTGIVAAYGVPWDRPTSVAGMPQNGTLRPLHRVKARNVEIRG